MKWRYLLVLPLLALAASAADRWPDAGGGGGATWFAALQLFDQKMGGALLDGTYEYHHWSSDDENAPLVTIDAHTVAESTSATTGSCGIGLIPNVVEYIYDLATVSCASAGGGTIGTICRCSPTATGYAPTNPIGTEILPHFWTTFAFDGGGGLGQGAAMYNTDLPGFGYAKPILRLDTYDADSCVTIEEVSRPVTFQARDNPVFYYEVTPWNYDARTDAEMIEAVADSITFVGWKREEFTLSTPSFNSYIDTSPGTTTAALDVLAINTGFGIMWVGSKWHAVWVLDGVLVQDDVVLDPVAVAGSLSNYLTLHMGGSTAFAIQTDVDSTYSGRKRGAYQLTNFVNSTNFHSQFVPFTMGTGGSIDSQTPTGVGNPYHRVISSCIKTGSATVYGRFMMTQMDVVK